MAATAVMRCEHLPNGGIQWLLLKPGMCFIGRCAPHRTRRIRMAIEIVADLPAFCVVANSLLLLPTNIAK
jgi:hypothetical protein